MLFKPLYLRGWAEEGILYRKGQYMVKKPVGKLKNYLLRKVGGKPGRQVTEMKANFNSLREACRAENQAIRKDARAARHKVAGLLLLVICLASCAKPEAQECYSCTVTDKHSLRVWNICDVTRPQLVALVGEEVAGKCRRY